MKYRTIVADPPWDHSDGTGLHVAEKRTTSIPYKPMTLPEIAALPVGELADSEAHLYLWTTSRFLFDAREIADRWGFAYIATLVWCKPSRGFSTGGAFQNNVEFVLFCRSRRPGNAEYRRLGNAIREQRLAIGMNAKTLCAAIGAHGAVNHGGAVANWENGFACPTWDQWLRIRRALNMGDALDAEVRRLNDAKVGPLPQAATSRWYQWPRGEHSAKPEAFLDLVEQVSPGPYLELFARRARFGWDYWGDQSLGTADMPAA